jgi:hypothetical protein
MIFKQQQHRRFDYQPLFYKPEEDPQVQRKNRIHFSRFQRARSPFSRSVIILMILLIAIFYGIYWFASRQ